MAEILVDLEFIGAAAAVTSLAQGARPETKEELDVGAGNEATLPEGAHHVEDVVQRVVEGPEVQGRDVGVQDLAVLHEAIAASSRCK
eukprot:3333106-Alexandrium_andersonii.AAC.1